MFVNSFDERRPRAKTARNSAGRLIRWLVGSDKGLGYLNGEPGPAFASASCENCTSTFSAHTRSEAVNALTSS